MAHTDAFPKGVLDRLEQEIRSQVSSPRSLFPESDARIGESYQVWKVTSRKMGATEDRDRMTPTRRWQHEILNRGGEPTGFARSMPTGE